MAKSKMNTFETSNTNENKGVKTMGKTENKNINNNANEGVKTMAKIEKVEKVLQKYKSNTVRSYEKMMEFQGMVIPEPIEYTEDHFWIWNPIAFTATSTKFMVKEIQYTLKCLNMNPCLYKHIIKWARDVYGDYLMVNRAAAIGVNTLKSQVDKVKLIESIYYNNDNEDFVLHRDLHDVGWIVVLIFFEHRLKKQ